MCLYDENPHIGCGDCKYFRINADREESLCKRIDHKAIKFYRPWFKSYDCGQMTGIICSDFTPAERCKYLYEHWTSIEEYCEQYKQAEGKDRLRDYLALTLNDDRSIMYFVRYIDFFNNDFIDSDGNVKWVKRCYYKKTRQGFGYKLVWEFNE